MRLVPLAVGLLVAGFSAAAVAKLPPLSDDAKAKAAEAAAKAAWGDKVAAFKLCQSMDRVAEQYRKSVKSAGKEPAAPVTTAACTDPGPYAAPTPVAARPLEASGAHSPPNTAATPPSTQQTAKELQGGSAKK
jgi:hypothetical protein